MSIGFSGFIWFVEELDENGIALVDVGQTEDDERDLGLPFSEPWSFIVKAEKSLPEKELIEKVIEAGIGPKGMPVHYMGIATSNYALSDLWFDWDLRHLDEDEVFRVG